MLSTSRPGPRLLTQRCISNNSAGASLNEPPRTGPQFSGDHFSRHLTEQQPSYICTRPENFSHQKIFSIRNMRPLSIREASRPGGGTRVFPPALSKKVRFNYLLQQNVAEWHLLSRAVLSELTRPCLHPRRQLKNKLSWR